MNVGHIVYTNAWPITFAFPPEGWGGRVNVVTAKPSELNALLAAGSVDVASVSSFAYARHADHLMLLPDLSVSAEGEVRSILLFAKEPLSSRLPSRIAMTDASATSIHLLKMLMFFKYDHQPDYVTMHPSLEEMVSSCDAALLIGDDAIRSSWTDHGLFVYDLGALWREWTGTGMTFAVWAVRKSWAEAHSDELLEIHEALLESKVQGLRLPEPLLQAAVSRIGGMHAFWRTYFRGLTYDFGAEQMKGLRVYLDYAHRMGFLARIPPLHVWRHPKL